MTTQALRNLRDRVSDRVANLTEATAVSGTFIGDLAIARHSMRLELLERDRDMLAILDALIQEAGE